MLARNSNTGAFAVYDISNNSITSAASMGDVGLEWTVSGFGDFSGNANETDILMRNTNTGQFNVYDISNNAITSAASIGTVGLAWTVAGFGDFSTFPGEGGDMLMRSPPGTSGPVDTFRVYDITNNTVTPQAAFSFSDLPGTAAADWTVAGFGDFSGNLNETDMMMRDQKTAAVEIVDISRNKAGSAVSLGAIGTEWAFAGFGDFSGNANETDMLLRNSNTGAFEVYDISHNAVTSAASMGQVGMEWTVAGIAADPPAAASPAGPIPLLVHAMAGFTSDGAALATGSIGATATSDVSTPAMLLAAHPLV